jgi:excisionase family DNA binding protein
MLTLGLGERHTGRTMATRTLSLSGLEGVVRDLQREVAELRARLDALSGTPVDDRVVPRHSKGKLAWAKRYGIDLDEFVPRDGPPVGTYTMSAAEAAGELGLSLEQVRRHLRSGELRGTALRGRAGWRVSRADVDRLRQTREALSAGRRR